MSSLSRNVPRPMTRSASGRNPASEGNAAGSEPVPYEPIDCSYHDRLESFATFGTLCRIAFRDSEGARAEVVARITDVFSRGDEEFLTTTETGPIRLDRLESVQAERA